MKTGSVWQNGQSGGPKEGSPRRREWGYGPRESRNVTFKSQESGVSWRLDPYGGMDNSDGTWDWSALANQSSAAHSTRHHSLVVEASTTLPVTVKKDSRMSFLSETHICISRCLPHFPSRAWLVYQVRISFFKKSTVFLDLDFLLPLLVVESSQLIL